MSCSSAIEVRGASTRSRMRRGTATLTATGMASETSVRWVRCLSRPTIECHGGDDAPLTDRGLH